MIWTAPKNHGPRAAIKRNYERGNRLTWWRAREVVERRMKGNELYHHNRWPFRMFRFCAEIRQRMGHP